MRIMNYEEREALKKLDYEKFAPVAHWHRFIGNLFGASGFEIDDADIPVTIEEYKRLQSMVPGWSYPRIRYYSRHWNLNNPAVIRINELYGIADANRKKMAEKYPAITEQEDDIII